MNKFLITLILSLFSATAFAATADVAKVPNATLRIGKNATGNKTLQFNKGTAATPGVRLNTSSNKIEFSHDGTTWDVVNLGSDIDSASATLGQVLTADGAGASAFSTPPDALRSSHDNINIGLATSVAASALTVTLKDADGNAPTTLSPVKISFRSTTAGTGTQNQQTVVSATAGATITVPSGATLGASSNGIHNLFVYALNNAGTVELAISGTMFDESSVLSTTILNTSSDSIRVVYSTTARTNVAARLIGMLTTQQTTTGDWAANMTRIALPPFDLPQIYVWAESTNAQTVNQGSYAAMSYATEVYDTWSSWSTNAFTCPRSGIYWIAHAWHTPASSFASGGCEILAKATVTSPSEGIVLSNWFAETGNNDGPAETGSGSLYCDAGGIIQFQMLETCAGSPALSTADDRNYIQIRYVGDKPN